MISFGPQSILAGLVVFGLVLTAFRSLLLLYESNRANESSKRNYDAGYDLFLMVIFGSGLYVLMNALSVVNYAIVGSSMLVPDERLSTSIAGSFFAAWVLLVVFKPLELTACIRSTRSRHGNLVFSFLVVLLACGMIAAEAVILPRSLLLGWPSWLWSLVFLAAMFVWILIASVLWKRDETK